MKIPKEIFDEWLYSEMEDFVVKAMFRSYCWRDPRKPK
jgi:hypothetical protein